MLKEIEAEIWEGDDLKIEDNKLGFSYKIMEDLSKYVIFDREAGFLDRNYWTGRVLCNGAEIQILETKKKDGLFHLLVPFAYVKETPEEDLEQIRQVFQKYGLTKQVRQAINSGLGK